MKKYLSFICLLIVSFTLCITPAFGKTPESYFDNAKTIPWTIEPKYEDIEPYKTTILVKQNELWGMINTKGEWIIKPMYADVVLDHTEMATPEKLIGVKYNNLWGFIDEQGKVVIKPQFESVQNFNEGLAPAKKEGKWGFINTKGEWVIKPQYEYTTPFKEGFARIGEPEIVAEGEKGHGYDGYTPWGVKGFIDKTGKQIISVVGKYGPPRYVGDFSYGLARVVDVVTSYDRNSGFINTKGEKQIKGYHDVGNFCDGIAWVLGFNVSEEEVDKIIEAGKNDDATMKKIKTLEYIDPTGKVVISDKEADDMTDFHNGISILFRTGKDGETIESAAIDKTGKTIIPFGTQVIWGVGEGLISTRENCLDGSFKFGIKDWNNKYIISPVTSIGLTDVEANILLFVYDNRCYILDDKAKVVGKVEGTNAAFNDYSPYIRIAKDGLWGLVVNPLFEKEESSIK